MRLKALAAGPGSPPLVMPLTPAIASTPSELTAVSSFASVHPASTLSPSSVSSPSIVLSEVSPGLALAAQTVAPAG